MKALRLPARANLVPYGFGCRLHALLLVFVIAEALLTGVEEARQARVVGQPASPSPACCARGRERDLSGFLAIRPVPLPWSKTPAELADPHRCGPASAAPGPNTPKASAPHDFEANAGL
jgi:hypothetical protein